MYSIHIMPSKPKKKSQRGLSGDKLNLSNKPKPKKSYGPKERRHYPPSESGCHRYIGQLKANNRSLAEALDEARQLQRQLQNEILQLREERQQLLETVANLENKALLDKKGEISSMVHPVLKLLNVAQGNIQRAKEIVESKSGPKHCVATAGNILVLSPISDNLVTNGAKVHFELSSAPIGPTGKATYPKTPHPKHGKDKGPQLASTPLQDDSESISMVVSPHAIDFSGIESDASSCKKGRSKEASLRKKKLPTKGKRPLSEDNLPGLPQGGGKSFQESDTFELLESMLGTRRPKRKCASLSVSYQEPSLCKKLRRGDPFTETATDWSPPDPRPKKRPKKSCSTNGKERKFLRDLTNKK